MHQALKDKNHYRRIKKQVHTHALYSQTSKAIRLLYVRNRLKFKSLFTINHALNNLTTVITIHFRCMEKITNVLLNFPFFVS